MVEVELLAAGLLQRLRDAQRPRDAARHRRRRAAAGRHAAAATAPRATRTKRWSSAWRCEMQRAGRIVWRGLSLRARGRRRRAPRAWAMAMPDVYSIRHTTVEDYLEPRGARDQGQPRRPAVGPAPRGQARGLPGAGGQCWYVLREGIAAADEIPPECGVMLAGDAGAGRGPRRRPSGRCGCRFRLWMALARCDPRGQCVGPGRASLARRHRPGGRRRAHPLTCPHHRRLCRLTPPRPSHRAARERKALWAALALILVWGANFACRRRCSPRCRRAASCSRAT